MSKKILLSMCLLFATACARPHIMYLDSDVPARIWVNGYDMGRTPVEVPIEFGGVHEVRLLAEGYETFWGAADMSFPWWEDIFGRALSDVKKQSFYYELQPMVSETPAKLLEQAQEMRSNLSQE